MTHVCCLQRCKQPCKACRRRKSPIPSWAWDHRVPQAAGHGGMWQDVVGCGGAAPAERSLGSYRWQWRSAAEHCVGPEPGASRTPSRRGERGQLGRLSVTWQTAAAPAGLAGSEASEVPRAGNGSSRCAFVLASPSAVGQGPGDAGVGPAAGPAEGGVGVLPGGPGLGVRAFVEGKVPLPGRMGAGSERVVPEGAFPGRLVPPARASRPEPPSPSLLLFPQWCMR